MKVKLPPFGVAMHKLTQAFSPITGTPRRSQSLDVLMASVRLEEVMTFCLGQEPETPGVNRLKFLCFEHEADGRPHTPSLYCNVAQQRWGCESGGCFGGRSDDVLGFVRTVYGLTAREGVAWLQTWAHTHRRMRTPLRTIVRSSVPLLSQEESDAALRTWKSSLAYRQLEQEAEVKARKRRAFLKRIKKVPRVRLLRRR